MSDQERWIRDDERRKVLEEVLRGLESEVQTIQVRAVIAEVRAMRDAKPEAGAELDEERLAEALGRLYDDPVWENIDPWSREFAGMIAAAYAEAATPRNEAKE